MSDTTGDAITTKAGDKKIKSHTFEIILHSNKFQ